MIIAGAGAGRRGAESYDGTATAGRSGHAGPDGHPGKLSRGRRASLASGTAVSGEALGLVMTTANDGSETHSLGRKRDVNGTYTFSVCEAGTSTCSNTDCVSY